MAHKSILQQWYWHGLISLAFVVLMTLFFSGKYPAWLHYSYRGVSLTHEMSYGVWWSAIGLFIAGIIFAKVALLSMQQYLPAWPWYVLSVAMVALCFDEIGSLHETVARFAGWQGLLPFAMIFGIGFLMALASLFKRRAMRGVVALVMIGISIFTLVAGLEFIEHDPNFLHHFWRRFRLVGEETSELIAIGILITAGLTAMKRTGDTNCSFLNATSVVERLYQAPMLIFLLFLLQVILTLVLIVPNYTFFPEGNPSALFPVCLFFCLGILARQEALQGHATSFWRIQAVLFFAASIMQMYNFNTYINNLFLIDIPLFVRAPFSWMIAVVPYLLLALVARAKGRIEYKEILKYLFAFFLFALVVVSEMRLRFRVEYLFLAFSSTVAYSCFQLMLKMRSTRP